MSLEDDINSLREEIARLIISLEFQRKKSTSVAEGVRWELRNLAAEIGQVRNEVGRDRATSMKHVNLCSDTFDRAFERIKRLEQCTIGQNYRNAWMEESVIGLLNKIFPKATSAFQRIEDLVGRERNKKKD